jgi:hypothetical protein
MDPSMGEIFRKRSASFIVVSCIEIMRGRYFFPERRGKVKTSLLHERAAISR